jgi:hypothetical protein
MTDNREYVRLLEEVVRTGQIYLEMSVPTNWTDRDQNAFKDSLNEVLKFRTHKLEEHKERNR